jgi:hypothetical protein
LIAGEGCFLVGSIGTRNDGSERLRFRFTIKMADREVDALRDLHGVLGVGAISFQAARRATWQPTATYSVHSRRAIRTSLIPFCDEHLLWSFKRQQYLHWRERFITYESRFPSNWGAGPSPCSIPGCDKPVRGRGLCRAHYYRETGY